MQSWDASQFAKQLRDLLEANGWTPVGSAAIGGGMATYLNAPGGIWISVGGSSDSRLGAWVIQQAFETAGIHVGLERAANFSPNNDSITINVGTK